MKVPFYDPTREYKNYKDDFDKAIQNVMESGDFILGKEVSNFEEQIKEYTGAKYAVGTANGSDALVICSDILKFSGAEVLTPAFTFFASASCIARLGGKPIFVDADENTFNMDMRDAENRLNKNTKGIIPVHLFLQTADMNACIALAEKYNLTVLEDAAESFGMKTNFKGKMRHSGTLGDFGIFSFFPTKTLGGCGDGGMIVTNNEELYLLAKSYRTHGTTKKYYHDHIGYNSRLDTMQAAILNVKFSHIEDSIQKRAKHAEHYRELLKSIPEIKLPFVSENNLPINYVFNLQAEKRDKLMDYLKQNEIGTSVYYPLPLHLQKCFEYLDYKKGDFPVAEKLSEKVLALPMFPELLESEVDYVCECIIDYYRN